jgi:retron-type reverse transcriptase
MKRANSLFEEIVDYRNIRLAFLKAIRGKRSSVPVLLFCRDVDGGLARIRRRFLSGDVQWGPYRSFTITDPKERIITAAPIEDRIMQHAIMNALEAVFERQMIFHTYACRKGKGMHDAVRYAFAKCKSTPCFLKLDIRKYFDSINHDMLYRQLERLIKDRNVLRLLRGIIDSYQKTPGKGIPIGNLTSQWFANLYLSPLDHSILEHLRPRAYVRYMDDFVLWADEKKTLREMLQKIDAFVAERLDLRLKPPVIADCADGLPFLGFMIKERGIYLLGKSKTRIKRRAREIEEALTGGVISEEQAGRRIISVCAAVQLARTRRFRVQLWHGKHIRRKIDPSDITGPASGTNRVIRGGSWNNNASNCTVANRNNNAPQQSEQQHRVPGVGCPLSPAPVDTAHA